MLTRKQKEQMVAEFTDVMRKDQTALFVDYQGVNTQGMRTLRGKLREHGGILRVVRKTLFRRALHQAGIAEVPAETLEGQVAIVYGFTDPVGVSKAISAFRKELAGAVGGDVAFTVRGGLLSGSALSAKEAEVLALIPSRQELLGRLAGFLASPLSGLVQVLSGPQRSFVYVLQAKSKVETTS